MIKTLQTIMLAFLCFAGTAIAQDFAFDASVKAVSVESSVLKVYPNPTTDYFSITNDQEIKYIFLFNIVGKEIAKFKHDANKLHSLSDFKNGIYIIRLYDENKDVIKVLRLHKK